MNLNLKPERTLIRSTFIGSLAVVFFACAAPWLNADSLTQVTINTSTLVGQTENLVFDFDLGGGTQSNTVAISNFYTDGTLSPIYQASNAGVTGTLPGNLTFTSGQTVVEELYVTEVLGNTITFDIDSTNNAPTAGAFPDEFDVYLLDPASFETVLPSNDPSGAGSLLAVDLYGGSSPTFTNFSASGDLTSGPPAVPTTASAEPAGLLVFGLALLAVGCPVGRTRLLRLFRHSPTLGPITALSFAFAFAPALSAQSPVTNVGVDANFTVTFSGLRFNHATNQYVSIATITNTAFIYETIPGPFYLGITSSGGPVYLANPTGQLPDGSAGIAITTPAMLGPRQSTTINVIFTDPSTKTFTVVGKVWDAASNPPAATLLCPQGVTAPGLVAAVSNYTTPTDSVGRVAACIPAPGTLISTYNPTGTCSTVSAYYAPAACSFTVSTPNIAPAPIITSGTITLGSPEQTDLRLIPCVTLAASFSPAYVNYITSSSLPLAYECGFQPAATASYSIYNYGPNPAYNFSITMKFPPGPSNAAWRFSQANTCAPPVPQTFSIETPSGPELADNGGEDVTCTFAELDPYQYINANIGLDIPSSENVSNVPAIEIDVALDSTKNFTADTTDLSALLTLGSGPVGSVTVPASISVKSQPCTYSNSPGFAILLNTCGVPTVVNEVLVGTFLGVVTVLTGGAGVALDVTELGSSVIFDANQGAALILTR